VNIAVVISMEEMSVKVAFSLHISGATTFVYHNEKMCRNPSKFWWFI